MAPTVRRLIPLKPLTPDAFAPFGSVIQNPSSAPQKTYSQIITVHANQGSAAKYADISPLDNFYALASSKKSGRGAISLFSCKPRATRSIDDGKTVFDVKILERHPYTTQTFSPLGLAAQDANTRYLVIVAPTLPSGDSRAQILQRPSAYPTQERSRRDRLPGVLSRAKSTEEGLRDGKLPKGVGPPDLNGVQAFIARGDQAVTYEAGTWHAPMVVLGERPVDFTVVQFLNGVSLEDCQEKEVEEGIAVDLTQLTGRIKSRL